VFLSGFSFGMGAILTFPGGIMALGDINSQPRVLVGPVELP
jgi:hypothetical protein